MLWIQSILAFFGIATTTVEYVTVERVEYREPEHTMSELIALLVEKGFLNIYAHMWEMLLMMLPIIAIGTLLWYGIKWARKKYIDYREGLPRSQLCPYCVPDPNPLHLAVYTRQMVVYREHLRFHRPNPLFKYKL
jgi:hypothetical protein